jgi:hypothetical protein
LRHRAGGSSLDDFSALLIQELVTAVGTEKFDLFVPKFLPVAIKFAVTLWTGHPKNLRHGSFPPQQNKIRKPNFEIRNKLEVNVKLEKSKTANRFIFGS